MTTQTANRATEGAKVRFRLSNGKRQWAFVTATYADEGSSDVWVVYRSSWGSFKGDRIAVGSILEIG